MPEHDKHKKTGNNEDAGAMDAPSKSEVKRQMLQRQKLGESLLELSEKQLAGIPIDDDRLLEAIHETRQIQSNSARKRHLQLIGKLMRDIDPKPIEKAMGALHQQRQQSTDAFHELEQLRDDMLAAGATGVELAVQRWPGADRQQLRQLVLQHQRELRDNKPPAASRKLFRYLRECQELYGEGD